MWKMVLLFCRFVVTSCNIVNQQNNKTTKQQDNKSTNQQDNKINKSVWKTVPSEARVTRDEVSGLIDRKEASVWKTVPFSIRKKNQQIKIRLKK